MKIGILTPYDSANFGAYLQAYATMAFLKSEGHQVYFLKWRSEEERKKIFFRHEKDLKSMAHFCIDYLHRKKNYVCLTQALEEFNVISIDSLKDNAIEAVIIGSDEVWNINVKSFQNRCFYGLDYFEGIPCLAYAPSAGNASLINFEKYPEHANGLRNIDIIGVRDANTQKIVDSICGRKPEIVCDPTCLVKPEVFPAFVSKPIKEPYILVYSYAVSEQLKKYIKQFAFENKLKTVSVCMKQSWCDINLTCTPMEFIGLIKKAAFVFTTTFHGTIFTLMQHKKCVIEAKSKKLEDLLDWTCMTNKIIDIQDDYNTFKRIIQREEDFSEYEKSIITRREFSNRLYRDKLEKLCHG